MQEEHREKIRRNIDKLKLYTNYEVLMDACLKRELLFDVMRDSIERDSNKRKWHDELLLKITHRGPTAYDTFLDILKQQFPEAHEILTHQSYSTNNISIRGQRNANSLNRQTSNEPNEPSTPPSDIQPSNGILDVPCSSSTVPTERAERTINLVEYTAELTPKVNYGLEKSTQFHGESASSVECYPMRSQNRGILVFVNNIQFETSKHLERFGAESDRDNFITLFRQMGFKILYYENLRQLEFYELLKKLCAWPELSKYDCFVFAIFSHGDRSDTGFSVKSTDELPIEVEDILVKFNNNNCKYLVGKPKIFFFPFCRGAKADRGISEESKNDQKIARRTATDGIGICTTLPTFSDMKICYSTVPGYYSFRDSENGSWYVSALCQAFAQWAHNRHLEELLKITGTILSQMRSESGEVQTASNEDRGFNKILYFNPGFYGDR